MEGFDRSSPVQQQECDVPIVLVEVVCYLIYDSVGPVSCCDIDCRCWPGVRTTIVSSIFATGRNSVIGRYHLCWSSDLPGLDSGMIYPLLHVFCIISVGKDRLTIRVK